MREPPSGYWMRLFYEEGPREQVQGHKKEIMFSCPRHSMEISLTGLEQATRKVIDEFREVILGTRLLRFFMHFKDVRFYFE